MLSYEDIASAIRDRKPKRAYLLWGEEPLFIDKLAEIFSARLIPAEEQSLNQIVFYGYDKEVDCRTILGEAMRFPMMGERTLVLVRDAQQVRDIDDVAPYLDELPDTACLVLCYRKKIDKRKALYKAFDKLGTHYESTRLSDSRVPDFIVKSFTAQRMQIDHRSAQLMAEHTGNDLEKILGEVAKLSIVLGERGGTVTPELIEEHVGISKEYNNFELRQALIDRNAARAFRIAQYFAANERLYPIQMTLPILFGYFSQLMAVYYVADKSERGIASALGVSPYAARDYIDGARHYTAAATFSIIHQIRMTDAASKGVDSNAPGGELLRELIAFILACR